MELFSPERAGSVHHTPPLAKAYIWWQNLDLLPYAGAMISDGRHYNILVCVPFFFQGFRVRVKKISRKKRNKTNTSTRYIVASPVNSHTVSFVITNTSCFTPPRSNVPNSLLVKRHKHQQPQSTAQRPQQLQRPSGLLV